MTLSGKGVLVVVGSSDGASGLRDKPTWRSLRLKPAAIWGMSVQLASSDSCPAAVARRQHELCCPLASWW